MNIGFVCAGYEDKMTGMNRYSKGILEQLDNVEFNKYCFGKNYFGINNMNEIHAIYENGFEYDKMMKERYLLGCLADIDIIHSFYRPIWLENSNMKTVITIHDLVPLINLHWCVNNQQFIYDLFNIHIRKSAEKADKVVAVSRATKEAIVNIYDIPEEKIEIVTPAISSELLCSEITEEYLQGVKQKYSIIGDYVLSICTLQPRKNLISLVEAYEIYKDKNKDSDIKLVLAGKLGWRFDNILQKINNSRFKEDIVLTDYISENEMGALYKGACIFAYVSYYEGFGMPILEAMHYGKAVLTSNTTSMPEVGGDAVCYCDPYDLESIYTSLEYLLEDKVYRESLQKKSILQAEKFSYQKSAKKLGKIFCDLCGIS